MNPAQMPRRRQEPMRTLTAMLTPVLMRLTPPWVPKGMSPGGYPKPGAGAEVLMLNQLRLFATAAGWNVQQHTLDQLEDV